MVLLTAMENKTNLNIQDLQLDAYLYKPVTPEDVIGCLSRLFETSD